VEEILLEIFVLTVKCVKLRICSFHCVTIWIQMSLILLFVFLRNLLIMRPNCEACNNAGVICVVVDDNSFNNGNNNESYIN
jgi:hypothetical protein